MLNLVLWSRDGFILGLTVNAFSQCPVVALASAAKVPPQPFLNSAALPAYFLKRTRDSIQVIKTHNEVSLPTQWKGQNEQGCKHQILATLWNNQEMYSCIASRSVIWHDHFGKLAAVSLKAKNTCVLWARNSGPGCISEKNENTCPQKHCTWLSLAALFMTDKN